MLPDELDFLKHLLKKVSIYEDTDEDFNNIIVEVRNRIFTIEKKLSESRVKVVREDQIRPRQGMAIMKLRTKS